MAESAIMGISQNMCLSSFSSEKAFLKAAHSLTRLVSSIAIKAKHGVKSTLSHNKTKPRWSQGYEVIHSRTFGTNAEYLPLVNKNGCSNP